MSEKIDKILSGATTAFIDSTNKSSAAYKPDFISNDHTKGVKVLTSIEEELKRCDSFTFSVAFITLGGIEPLLLTFKELEERGVPGKVLTTDYNMFTDPKALDKLAEFKNIELRMYHEDAVLSSSEVVGEGSAALEDGTGVTPDTERIGFHTKGYIFRRDETYTFIIGSSNMTGKALSVNKEWNTKMVSTAEGEMYKNIQSAFDALWDDKNHTSKYEDFIEEFTMPQGINLSIEEPGIRHEGFHSCMIQASSSEQNDVFTIVATDILNELSKQEEKEKYIEALKNRMLDY